MFYRRLKPSFGGEGSNEFGPMPDGQSQSYHTLLAPNCQAMMKTTPAVCCKLRDAGCSWGSCSGVVEAHRDRKFFSELFSDFYWRIGRQDANSDLDVFSP